MKWSMPTIVNEYRTKLSGLKTGQVPLILIRNKLMNIMRASRCFHTSLSEIIYGMNPTLTLSLKNMWKMQQKHYGQRRKKAATCFLMMFNYFLFFKSFLRWCKTSKKSIQVESEYTACAVVNELRNINVTPLPFSQYSPFIEFCDQLAW